MFLISSNGLHPFLPTIQFEGPLDVVKKKGSPTSWFLGRARVSRPHANTVANFPAINLVSQSALKQTDQRVLLFSMKF